MKLNKSAFLEKRFLQILLILFAVTLMFISLFGDKGLVQYYELKEKQEFLIEKIEDLKEEYKISGLEKTVKIVILHRPPILFYK